MILSFKPNVQLPCDIIGIYLRLLAFLLVALPISSLALPRAIASFAAAPAYIGLDLEFCITCHIEAHVVRANVDAELIQKRGDACCVPNDCRAAIPKENTMGLMKTLSHLLI